MENPSVLPHAAGEPMADLYPTTRDSPLKALERKRPSGCFQAHQAGTGAAKAHVEPGSWSAPTSGPLPHQHQEGPGLHPQALHV